MTLRHRFSPPDNTRLAHLCGPLDEHLRTYLFKDVPVTEIEEKATGKSGGDGNESSSSDGSLGIGSLRPETAKNGGAKS